jgi:membrane protein YdbS with pleckstrin-like domain
MVTDNRSNSSSQNPSSIGKDSSSSRDKNSLHYQSSSSRKGLQGSSTLLSKKHGAKRYGVASHIILHQTWRAHVSSAVWYWLSLPLCIWLSRMMSWSIIKGTLLEIGHYQLVLGLPLFWLIPATTIMVPLFRIYNVQYTITPRGLEVKRGILWTNQDINKVAFEDILSVETKQNLIERILNIGKIEVGTSATEGVEIVFEGVSRPLELRKFISEQRDRAEEHRSSK